MKKLAIVFVSALLLLTLVGCGTFSYNIRSYVDVADPATVTIKQADVDSKVKESVESLLSNYKGEDDVTTGTVEEGMTAYIFFKGVATLYEGPFSFKMGDNAFKGLDEALKDVEFKDGKAEVTFKLAEDFTFPTEIAKAMKDKADRVEAESKETETPTAETATPTAEDGTVTPTAETESKEASSSEVAEYRPAFVYDDETPDGDASPATETAEETTDSEEDYSVYNSFAGSEITVALSVEGKEGKLADGENVPAVVKITNVFSGGTYNEENETNLAEGTRSGYKLEIGSNAFIKGFEDGMIGMSVEKGTKKSLDLTFPSPYNTNNALSGMDVVFEVEIRSVTKIYERDLDNAEQFAALKADYEKNNGEGSFDYADKAAYMAKLTSNVKASLASEAVVNKSKVKKWKYSDLDDYKSAARNNLLNTYISYYYQMTGQFLSSEEQVISTFFGGDSNSYLQSIANQAGKNLKNDWVLYQIAKDKGLDKVSDEEYKTFLTEQLAVANAGVTDEANKMTESTLVSNIGGKSAVEKYVVLEKAQKWLGENVAVV